MAKSVNVRDASELSEVAWAMVDEALRSGTITLEASPRPIVLDGQELIGLIKWVATVKKNKPKFLATPEDFTPAVTGDQDEEETS